MASESPTQELTTSDKHDVEANVERPICDNTKEREHAVSETITNTKLEGEDESAFDPTLPLNWSASKKFVNMAVPSILCFVTEYHRTVYTSLLRRTFWWCAIFSLCWHFGGFVPS
jgi:hypothetical protein